MFGREATRIGLASHKYICDTCDQRLSAEEGYLLTTKQVVSSIESWRRVLLNWKRQLSAQSKQSTLYLDASDDASKRGYLFVTMTKEKTESMAEIMRQVIPKLKREYSEVFVDLVIGFAYSRVASETPWVICETCAPIFSFDRDHARDALEMYRRTGQFQRGQAVLTLEIPKTGGRVLVKSNDDETLVAMLKAIDTALGKDLGD